MKGERRNSIRGRCMKLSMASITVLLILTAIAVTSLAVIPVIAQAVEVTVNAPAYVEEGATFVATIDVDDVADLNSAKFDLSFNPDVIEVSDVKKGKINGDEVSIFMWHHIDADTVGVIIMLPGESVSGSGYLAEVEFEVEGDEGDVSVLDISDGELKDKGGEPELFSIDKKFKGVLNDEEISDNLKEIFEDEGYPLENPTVEVIKENFWDIIDFPKRVYGVTAQSSVLKICDKGIILANWHGAEVKIAVEEKDDEEDEEVDEEVTPVSSNITAWKPAEAVVNDTADESRTFNISLNRISDISWQINGTEVQTNESVTEASFTKTADIGYWNVSAIATNSTTGLSDMHTWIWRVAATATVTPTEVVGERPPAETEVEATPTPTLAPRVTPAPTAAPPTDENPTPTPPGFEAILAIAVMPIAYILLRRGGR